jgi:hypothetical protein
MSTQQQNVADKNAIQVLILVRRLFFWHNIICIKKEGPKSLEALSIGELRPLLDKVLWFGRSNKT